MERSRKIKIIQALGFAFIFFLFIASNQANLRKSLAETILSYGDYYFNGGEYDLEKAESRYKLALFFDPQLPWAHYQLSRVYFVENRLPDALREINTELSLNPKNRRSYYIRGLINGYSADFQAAIIDFNRFIAWSPKEWAGYNDLAWAYYQAGDFQSSKGIALKGLEIFPDNVWLLNGLGAAELSLGNFSESQKIMEKVSTLADNLKISNWARAYPGNDPSNAPYELDKFKDSVNSNLALAKNEISIGGNFAAACYASCGGGHYKCGYDTVSLGYTAEYPGSWQWWCMGWTDGSHPGGDVLCSEIKPEECGPCGSCGDSRYKWCTGGQYGDGQCNQFPECQCYPNNCAASTCTGQSCWNGCNWEAGTLCCPTSPGCGASTCTGQSCWNGCNWEAGTMCCDTSWSPDPSTVCSGQTFTQTSNCGNTRSATGTKNCAPIVTTGGSSTITTSQASLSGNVASTGGVNPSNRYIQYGLTTSYVANCSAGGGGTGSFSCNTVNTLSSGLLYHYRACATNTGGTGCGNDATFTTLLDPPKDYKFKTKGSFEIKGNMKIH